MSMLEALEAVIAVTEAKSRIFIYTQKTFFGANDYWGYIEIGDDKLCGDCAFNASYNTGIYNGTELRSKFPNLEIRDEDTITVNEHPNCRCILIRMSMKEPE